MTVKTAAKKPARKLARPAAKAKAPARPAAKKTAKAAKAAPLKAPAKRAAPGKVPPRTAAPKKAARTGLAQLVALALDDMKAQHVMVFDVRGVTDVTDTIVIASGTSDRHVKSLASSVVHKARESGFRTLGVEGEREGEWVLVDLQDVIVHVMLPRIREFYALEKLWDVRSTDRGGTA
jgi:ribosome-associated protein